VSDEEKRSSEKEKEKGAILIVSADTGEVLDRVKPGDRMKITRLESLEYLSQFDDWSLEHFYKGHVGEIRKLMDELSTNEKAFLFAIAPCVNYDDCCLKYSNGKDITSSDLVKITGLGRGTVFDTIRSLTEKDIVYRGKNSKNRQYFVNPWIFCKGNRINKVLKTMFKNYRIRVMDGIRWRDLQELKHRTKRRR